MLNRRERDALRFAADEDVPPQAVKSDVLHRLQHRGLLTIVEIGEDEFKVEITEAGRKALAESQ